MEYVPELAKWLHFDKMLNYLLKQNFKRISLLGQSLMKSMHQPTQESELSAVAELVIKAPFDLNRWRYLSESFT